MMSLSVLVCGVVLLLPLCVSRVFSTSTCPDTLPCYCERVSLRATDITCDGRNLTTLPDWSIIEEVVPGHLHLEDNRITRIPPRAFRLSFVRTKYKSKLVLSYNHITHIDDDAFMGMVAEGGLELVMNNCDMRSFPKIPINRFRNFTSLYLRHNKLQSLPPRAFHNLHRLERLDLSDNPLSVLVRDAFSGLEHSLRSIYINNANITTFPVNAFNKLAVLEGIRMDNNHITHLQPRAFTTFYTTAPSFVLSLGHNRITTVPADTFLSSNLTFSYICLEGNQISDLSFLAAPCNSSFGSLTTIDVAHNPLECDCIAYQVANFPHYMLSGECDDAGLYSGYSFTTGEMSFVQTAVEQCDHLPELEHCHYTNHATVIVNIIVVSNAAIMATVSIWLANMYLH